MSQQNATAHSPVLHLIQQREQLRQWIARLDEVAPQAPSRVTERVREDYADRLRRVNEDLAAHREEIEADLAAQREALGRAEQQRAQAADVLEEARLRHLIGELDEAAWSRQRPELESAVARADEALVHARGEVERLHALAGDIAASAAPSEPVAEPSEPFAGAAEEDEWEPSFAAADPEPVSPEPPAPADEPAAGVDAVAQADAAGADEWDPFGAEFGPPREMGDTEESLPWLEGIDEAAKAWTPPAPAEDDSGLDFLRDIEESARTPEPPSGDLGADDLAFLEELDRAIGAPPASASGRGAAPTPPPAVPQPAPGAGGRAEPLLCKECGAINEPHSWYCEICGSEL